MKNVICVYKPIGLSPLQAINRVRQSYPEFKNQIMGYAGRLDPMAEGLLLLMVGDENKKRKLYERLNKEYKFEILLGIETDSFDLLGLITKIISKRFKIDNLKLKIADVLNTFIGTSAQSYPAYSSARVKGKPLYYWARKGQIDKITVPSHQITINRLKLEKLEELKITDLKDHIISKINLVKGDFRQEQIKKKWNEIFKQYPNIKLTKITCTISCSSGTYVRSIAHKLGQDLKTGGLAFSIKRTKIGDFIIKQAIQI